MYMITNSSGDKYKRLSSLLKLKCCSLDLGSQSPLYIWRNELFLAFSNSTESFNLPAPLPFLNDPKLNSLTTAIIQPLKNHVRFKKDFKAR